MEKIVSDVIVIIKGSKNEIETENRLWVFLLNTIIAIIALAFERIDDELAESYKAKGYKVERKDIRTIQGIFGPLTYKRRLMKKEEEKAFYPLDRQLGFERYRRYTPYLELCIVKLAARSVYRVVEESVKILSPVTISHQKVAMLVRDAGKRYSEYEETMLAVDMKPDEDLAKPDTLYIEGDGLYISRVNGKDPSQENNEGPGKKRRKKESNELHRIQLAEGVEQEGKGKRHRLVSKREFVDTDLARVQKHVERYLENYYNLQKGVVICNSDNGKGYVRSSFQRMVGECGQFEFFVDPYHVNQKVKTRLSFTQKTFQNDVLRALRQYDWEKVDAYLNTAESLAEIEEEHDQVARLRAYLERNWEMLKPHYMRKGLEKVAKCYGTCESNHRQYSYRMKKQGRRWGKEGCLAMAKVLAGLQNDELEPALSCKFEPVEAPQSAELRKALRSALKKSPMVPHVGFKNGRIGGYTASSTAIGHLSSIFRI